MKRIPPITGPFGLIYAHKHKKFVSDCLSNPELLDQFRANAELPDNFGVGFDERVVEFPWVASRNPRGQVLDAGSTLNHAHVLDHLRPTFESLSIVTLAPEPHSFPERGISYVYSDFAVLPFRENLFDVTISVSTLEHVGMDNSLYKKGVQRSADPDEHLETALQQLLRVTKPGGRMLITVPFGVPEDHGWHRQFDDALLDQMIGLIDPAEAETTFFRYRPTGWKISSAADSADARYATNPRAPSADGAIAARSVACIDLTLRS